MTEIQNVRTRHEWAEVINADWRKSFDGIIETGRNLVAAQDELSKSDHAKMIREDLPFSSSTAKKLRKIARHSVITGGSTSTPLPNSWNALETLASLSVEDFKDAQERGLIGADTSVQKAVAIRRAYKTDDLKPVGEDAAASTLPPPKLAREVARATNRMVAASDGNLYSGATEEEGAEHVRLRTQSYGVIDAINTIVDNGVSPKQWCEEVKKHWLNRFEFGRINIAAEWLIELKGEFTRQNLMFDCEAETDGE